MLARQPQIDSSAIQIIQSDVLPQLSRYTRPLSRARAALVWEKGGAQTARFGVKSRAWSSGSSVAVEGRAALVMAHLAASRVRIYQCSKSSSTFVSSDLHSRERMIRKLRHPARSND